MLRNGAVSILLPNGLGLEHLTELSDLVESDEGAAEDHAGLVDVSAPLARDGQAAEAVEPGQRALHDPAVPAQPLAAVDATSREAVGDRAGAAFRSAPAVVAGLVGVERVRALARTATAVTHLRHGGRGVDASLRLSWRLAGLGRTPSGVPLRTTTDRRFVPGLARDPSARTGSGAPLFRGHGGAVERRPAPVQMPGVRQTFQQHAMEPGPDAGRLPVMQPPPSGHAGAPELTRQHLPGNA